MVPGVPPSSFTPQKHKPIVVIRGMALHGEMLHPRKAYGGFLRDEVGGYGENQGLGLIR